MTQDTLTNLAELWEAAIPSLSPEEQHAAIVLLRELARGQPLSVTELARAWGTSAGEAAALLHDSPLSGWVYARDPGQVEGFWGLATSPMHHRFTVNGRTLWTWCAEDSLFLPQLLGETAEIESEDPESGELVRLRVSPDRVEAVHPSDVVVSMVRADTADLTSATRIIASACHFIFFFASRASGERWVAAHPQTMLLSLDEAFVLGKRQNRRLFESELARRGAAAAPPTGGGREP